MDYDEDYDERDGVCEVGHHRAWGEELISLPYLLPSGNRITLAFCEDDQDYGVGEIARSALDWLEALGAPLDLTAALAVLDDPRVYGPDCPWTERVRVALEVEAAARSVFAGGEHRPQEDYGPAMDDEPEDEEDGPELWCEVCGAEHEAEMPFLPYLVVDGDERWRQMIAACEECFDRAAERIADRAIEDLEALQVAQGLGPGPLDLTPAMEDMKRPDTYGEDPKLHEMLVFLLGLRAERYARQLADGEQS